MALLCSNVQLSHDSVTVGQHERYQDPEADWSSAITTFITALFICFKWEGPVSLEVVRHNEQLWLSQKEILE